MVRHITPCWRQINFLDTKKIISRSNIRSTDPTRGGIINKSIDKPIDDPIPTSSYDPNVEIYSTFLKIPISGEILGKDDVNYNQKPTRKSPRLHDKQIENIVIKEKGEEIHSWETIHLGEQAQTKVYLISNDSKEPSNIY